MQKYFIPTSIIVAGIIVGAFYSASQTDKLRELRDQQRRDRELEELKLKQDDCRALATGVMKKWNNVMGVTYDADLRHECVVTFTDTETGEVMILPLRLMKTTTADR
jgi:hypothetical protein